MPRLYFTIVCLFINIFAWAQKIHFTDKGNTWKIHYTSLGMAGYIQTISLPNIKATIREDTALGLVYAKPTSSPHGWLDTSVEQVLYDYNLVTGDTVTHYADGDTFQHYVFSMDTVIINNSQYRVWKFVGVPRIPPNLTMFHYSYTVVEGIGCTREPLFPLLPIGFEHSEILMCFTNRGTVSPLNKEVPYNFDNATSCTLSLLETKQHSPGVSISPHPLRTQSLLKLPKSMSGKLAIYDVTGRKIREHVIAQQAEIPLTASDYFPGMYMAKFTEAHTGICHFQKMLVE